MLPVAAVILNPNCSVDRLLVLSESTLNDVQGWSPYYFNHTAVYAWGTAVATLCLAILTPFVVNLVWGLCRAHKQKKEWYGSVLLNWFASKPGLTVAFVQTVYAS